MHDISTHFEIMIFGKMLSVVSSRRFPEGRTFICVRDYSFPNTCINCACAVQRAWRSATRSIEPRSSLLGPGIFFIFFSFVQDDRSSCSDDSGSDVFRSVPKNRTAFFVWKIEVRRSIIEDTSFKRPFTESALTDIKFQGLRAISVPRNRMGFFLSESAYIIYAVSAKDGPLPYPGVPVSVHQLITSILKTTLNIIKNIFFANK